MLDDSLDFRQREFALAGGGELRVDAVFTQIEVWRLSSMCVTLDGRWSVDYACDPGVYVRVNELQAGDDGCVQLRAVRATSPDPFADVMRPWADRLRALHPFLHELAGMAESLPVL